LSLFLEKCSDDGAFKDIIDIFYHYDIRYIQVIRGQELLQLFVKISHPIYWALNYPEIFHDTLQEETRKVVLFTLKLDIENYSKYIIQKEA
jgi:hypothetical protein